MLAYCILRVVNDSTVVSIKSFVRMLILTDSRLISPFGVANKLLTSPGCEEMINAILLKPEASDRMQYLTSFVLNLCDVVTAIMLMSMKTQAVDALVSLASSFVSWRSAGSVHDLEQMVKQSLEPHYSSLSDIDNLTRELFELRLELVKLQRTAVDWIHNIFASYHTVMLNPAMCVEACLKSVLLMQIESCPLPSRCKQMPNGMQGTYIRHWLQWFVSKTGGALALQGWPSIFNEDEQFSMNREIVMLTTLTHALPTSQEVIMRIVLMALLPKFPISNEFVINCVSFMMLRYMSMCQPDIMTLLNKYKQLDTIVQVMPNDDKLILGLFKMSYAVTDRGMMSGSVVHTSLYWRICLLMLMLAAVDTVVHDAKSAIMARSLFHTSPTVLMLALAVAIRDYDFSTVSSAYASLWKELNDADMTKAQTLSNETDVIDTYLRYPIATSGQFPRYTMLISPGPPRRPLPFVMSAVSVIDSMYDISGMLAKSLELFNKAIHSDSVRLSRRMIHEQALADSISPISERLISRIILTRPDAASLLDDRLRFSVFVSLVSQDLASGSVTLCDLLLYNPYERHDLFTKYDVLFKANSPMSLWDVVRSSLSMSDNYYESEPLAFAVIYGRLASLLFQLPVTNDSTTSYDLTNPVNSIVNDEIRRLFNNKSLVHVERNTALRNMIMTVADGCRGMLNKVPVNCVACYYSMCMSHILMSGNWSLKAFDELIWPMFEHAMESVRMNSDINMVIASTSYIVSIISGVIPMIPWSSSSPSPSVLERAESAVTSGALLVLEYLGDRFWFFSECSRSPAYSDHMRSIMYNLGQYVAHTSTASYDTLGLMCCRFMLDDVTVIVALDKIIMNSLNVNTASSNMCSKTCVGAVLGMLDDAQLDNVIRALRLDMRGNACRYSLAQSCLMKHDSRLYSVLGARLHDVRGLMSYILVYPQSSDSAVRLIAMVRLYESRAVMTMPAQYNDILLSACGGLCDDDDMIDVNACVWCRVRHDAYLWVRENFKKKELTMARFELGPLTFNPVTSDVREQCSARLQPSFTAEPSISNLKNKLLTFTNVTENCSVCNGHHLSCAPSDVTVSQIRKALSAAICTPNVAVDYSTNLYNFLNTTTSNSVKSDQDHAFTPLSELTVDVALKFVSILVNETLHDHSVYVDAIDAIALICYSLPRIRTVVIDNIKTWCRCLSLELLNNLYDNLSYVFPLNQRISISNNMPSLLPSLSKYAKIAKRMPSLYMAVLNMGGASFNPPSDVLVAVNVAMTEQWSSFLSGVPESYYWSGMHVIPDFRSATLPATPAPIAWIRRLITHAPHVVYWSLDVLADLLESHLNTLEYGDMELYTRGRHMDEAAITVMEMAARRRLEKLLFMYSWVLHVMARLNNREYPAYVRIMEAIQACYRALIRNIDGEIMSTSHTVRDLFATYASTAACAKYVVIDGKWTSVTKTSIVKPKVFLEKCKDIFLSLFTHCAVGMPSKFVNELKTVHRPKVINSFNMSSLVSLLKRSTNITFTHDQSVSIIRNLHACACTCRAVSTSSVTIVNVAAQQQNVVTMVIARIPHGDGDDTDVMMIGKCDSNMSVDLAGIGFYLPPGECDTSVVGELSAIAGHAITAYDPIIRHWGALLAYNVTSCSEIGYQSVYQGVIKALDSDNVDVVFDMLMALPTLMSSLPLLPEEHVDVMKRVMNCAASQSLPKEVNDAAANAMLRIADITNTITFL